MRTRGPDFIIGGAPRCGTTWLVELLDRHPGIRMARPFRPEPKFFLVDELYRKGLNHYLETWFWDMPDDVVAGEKSTNYLENDQVARRIAKHLPDVRLVFCLRNPVDRAYSNYLWSRQNGLEALEFEEAVSREKTRLMTLPPAYRYSRPWDYVSRGHYARHLKPYFDAFPRENIHILFFEHIASEPRRVAAQLHIFLGVDPRENDAVGLGAVNATAHDATPVGENMRRRLMLAFENPNAELAELLALPRLPWT